MNIVHLLEKSIHQGTLITVKNNNRHIRYSQINNNVSVVETKTLIMNAIKIKQNQRKGYYGFQVIRHIYFHILVNMYTNSVSLPWICVSIHQPLGLHVIRKIDRLLNLRLS